MSVIDGAIYNQNLDIKEKAKRIYEDLTAIADLFQKISEPGPAIPAADS